MKALRTVKNVELMRAGVEYNLSTGPTTFTPEDLRDAVMAANEDPSIPNPRLKIGHVDPRFNNQRVYDGTPSFGKAIDLRLSDNGMAVYADFVGVPGWLADLLPYAYPSRSVEGFWGVESQHGKKWQFVITACSLLGVTWPGIQTLEDLPLYYGDEVPDDVVIDAEVIAASAATASKQLGGDPVKTSASANLDDIRRAFYSDYIPANPDSNWWWVCAVMTDPNELVIEDDESGQLFLLPFSSDDAGDVSFGAATPVRIEYIPDDREIRKAAASHVAATLAVGRNVAASWSTRAESRPDNTGGAMDPKEVRKALNLPEDATDEQVHAALLVKAGLTVVEGGGEGGDPEKPVAPPVVVEPPAPEAEKPTQEAEKPAAVAASGLQLPPGTVLLDEATLADLKSGIAETRELKAERAENERKTLVAAAIQDGRIPPARKGHWEKYLELDPDGGKQVLASLAPNTTPVHERGHARAPVEPQEQVQLEAETVASWSEQLFPEVRAQRERDRAAAAGNGIGRSRIAADGNYRR